MKGRIDKLLKGVHTLMTGDCSDELIESTANDLGYYDPDMYYTADRSARYLGVSRSAFYELVKKYKLVNHKFNTVPIGYYLPELDKVKNILDNKKK